MCYQVVSRSSDPLLNLYLEFMNLSGHSVRALQTICYRRFEMQCYSDAESTICLVQYAASSGATECIAQPGVFAACRLVSKSRSRICCALLSGAVSAPQMWFWVSLDVLCGRVFEVYADRMGIDLGSIQVP